MAGALIEDGCGVLVDVVLVGAEFVRGGPIGAARFPAAVFVQPATLNTTAVTIAAMRAGLQPAGVDGVHRRGGQVPGALGRPPSDTNRHAPSDRRRQ